MKLFKDLHGTNKLLDKPIKIDSSILKHGNSRPLFAWGIFNPFGPTLSFIGLLEDKEETIELIKEKSGSVCVMDIYTGDIVSIVSSPTFDPNKFVHGISQNDWQTLIQDTKKPLINKSLAGLYPPGSTIKPIVALSALENDVISPKLVIQCRGSIELYGQKYHCWKDKGHGFMNLRNAIKQSCDIYFYEI